MRGLDRWITGNYGEDQYKETCEWCGEQPQYKRGLCRKCFQAGLEDEADRRREDERAETERI